MPQRGELFQQRGELFPFGPSEVAAAAALPLLINPPLSFPSTGLAALGSLHQALAGHHREPSFQGTQFPSSQFPASQFPAFAADEERKSPFPSAEEEEEGRSVPVTTGSSTLALRAAENATRLERMRRDAEEQQRQQRAGTSSVDSTLSQQRLTQKERFEAG